MDDVIYFCIYCGCQQTSRNHSAVIERWQQSSTNIYITSITHAANYADEVKARSPRTVCVQCFETHVVNLILVATMRGES